MITADRRAESDRVQASVRRWAECVPDVRAVTIVGSFACNDPTMGSDLDLVVLTDRKTHYIDSDRWIEDAVMEPAPIVRRMEWGPFVTERRLRLGSGFEIEFGFAPMSWASTDPLDPGTAGVVRNGCRPLYDPDGLLAELVTAVG